MRSPPPLLLFCTLALMVILAGTASPHAWAGDGLRFVGAPYVVDGDSLTFGQTEVRLLCLDAVELHQNCEDTQEKEYSCGVLARQAMIDLIAGRQVSCLGDEFDAYDRPLVVCRAGNTDLAQGLVREGWAIGLCKTTRKIARLAKTEGRGVWQGTFLRPSTWRKKNPRNLHENGTNHEIFSEK